MKIKLLQNLQENPHLKNKFSPLSIELIIEDYLESLMFSAEIIAEEWIQLPVTEMITTYWSRFVDCGIIGENLTENEKIDMIIDGLHEVTTVLLVSENYVLFKKFD